MVMNHKCPMVRDPSHGMGAVVIDMSTPFPLVSLTHCPGSYVEKP